MLEPRVNVYEKEICLRGGLAGMGKTVESFRMALESEINHWSGFARALRKEDREAFDELIASCRSYASESTDAADSDVFEPMILSILLAQQLGLVKIVYNPTVDVEPLVQLTEKGKQQAIELLFSQ